MLYLKYSVRTTPGKGDWVDHELFANQMPSDILNSQYEVDIETCILLVEKFAADVMNLPTVMEILLPAPFLESVSDEKERNCFEAFHEMFGDVVALLHQWSLNVFIIAIL